MLKHGFLPKRVLGFLLSVVVVITATACGPSDNTPAAPEITNVSVENNCDIRTDYVDHVTGDGVVFLRRSVDGSNSFTQIKVADKHGEQASSFLDEGLPAGTYSYDVGYFNSDVVKYSQKSVPIIIDEACGNDPLVIKPFNPFITHVEVIDNCTVRIWGVVYAEDADGVRVYRSTSGGQAEEIAELSLAEWNLGVGSYDDKSLHTGTYRYRMSVFNANGEAFSDSSSDVVISNASCNPTVEMIPTLIKPVIVSVATATSTPVPKACIWEAVVNVFVRKGPGASLYHELTAVEKGTQFPIVGQSQNGQFWVVEIHAGLNGYVPKAEKFSRTDGDCGNTSTIQDPPPPPTPIPTKTPRAIPQCSDGIDNDGDGAIDMRDLLGCTNPNDMTED
ncbi:MAG: hypothetical protein HY863_04765 [Chloroflexi bacterium]|nr:hypothetical protein [Chloroflexota bacterium]